MATRKTTTKAKTNTKKPAAKTRTAAAKTNAKVTKTKAVRQTAAKKVTTAKTAAKPVKNLRTTNLKTLRSILLAKTVLFAGLAVAAGFLMNSASYALTVGYQAKDELISLTQGKTAFVHASQGVMDIEIRWVVVTILGISALLSLLAATRMRAKYEASVVSGVSAMRWIGLGITSALIVETIALLAGISDIATLKVVVGLMLVTCTLAWIVEKRNAQAGRPVWSEFVVSLFTGLLPWLLIGSYALSTWVYGLVRYPWFVYALIGSTAVGFTQLTANQYKKISGWTNNVVIERNYLLIGTLTKVAFAVILIIGFQK
jgi:hypothetical protein